MEQAGKKLGSLEPQQAHSANRPQPIDWPSSSAMCANRDNPAPTVPAANASG